MELEAAALQMDITLIDGERVVLSSSTG